MNLIDGKKVSNKIREELMINVKKLKEEKGITPGLAVVIAGDNPASRTYVNSKHKACIEMGMHSEVYNLSENVSENELLELIDKLNNKNDIHGILVQLPLPSHINEKNVLEKITPEKDVDGFHPVNVGRLVIGEHTLLPCTPHGIVKLLEYENIEIEGKTVVVVGRSNIVGKPVSMLLLQKNATVIICHSKTKNLKEMCLQGDILIAAVGKPHFIKSDMVKPGAAVIDVGINRVEGKIVGDVDFEKVKDIAGFITPVPGGVGPMTITMLMYNTFMAAKNLKPGK